MPETIYIEIPPDPAENYHEFDIHTGSIYVGICVNSQTKVD